MSAPIKKAIEHIRGNGFWCRATERRIAAVIAKLRKVEVPDSIIAEVIVEMWSAVSAEYSE